MSTENIKFRAFLAELAEGRDQPVDDSITFQDLAALRAGRLSEDEAERVREVLATDPVWADLYLELDGSAGQASEEEVEREWRAFERRLEPGGRTLLPWRFPAASRPLVTAAAVAACLLLAIAGTWWLARATGPGQVSGRVLYAELEPADETRVLRGPAERLAPAADVERVVLRLHPPPILSLPPGRSLPEVARFRLTTAADRLAEGSARRQDDGAYVLDLAPGLLAAGDHEIDLFEGEAPDGEPIASYRFSLEREP